MAGHIGRRSEQPEGGGVVKFREIFRFEFAYQARRVWTWLFFVVMATVAFVIVA